MPTNCLNWAALWHRYGIESIDQNIGLVRLFALATLALCFCSDELRRVASFGSSAVLLLGIACGVALASLCGSFFRGLARAYEHTDCKISVRIDQSLTRTAVRKEDCSCDCPQAVNTAPSLGRLARRRPKRCN